MSGIWFDGTKHPDINETQYKKKFDWGWVWFIGWWAAVILWSYGVSRYWEC